MHMAANEWVSFNQAAPAWVQAIGSVGAVYLAGRAVILASRSARLNKLHGVDAIYKLCAKVITDARTAFASVQGAPANPSQFNIELFDYCSRLLAQIETAIVEIGSDRLPELTSEAAEILKSAEAQFKMALSVSLGSQKQNGILTTLDTKSARMLDLRAEVESFVKRQRRLTKWWWVPWITDI